MKIFAKMFVFVSILCTSACVSTGSQEEGSADSEDAIVSEAATTDDDVEKALAEVGGPIEESEPGGEPGEAPVDAPEADDTTFGEVAEPSVDAEAALSQDAVNTEDTASYKLEEAQPVTDVETPASEPSPALELESAPAPIAEEQPVVEDVAAPQAAEVANNDIGSELIYVVHRGESLSSVATQFLGKAKLWRKLAKLNKISNPNRIEVGMMLKIPVSDENRSKVEEFVAANEKKTKVKRGDTLAKIAKRVLGTKNAWRYLWKANESLIPNPNRIEVGQELGYLSKSSRRGTRKSAPNSH
jgi:nucleoid-associated protein YgaU